MILDDRRDLRLLTYSLGLSLLFKAELKQQQKGFRVLSFILQGLNTKSVLPLRQNLKKGGEQEMENGQHNTSLVVSVLTSTTDEITISKVE